MGSYQMETLDLVLNFFYKLKTAQKKKKKKKKEVKSISLKKVLPKRTAVSFKCLAQNT